MMSDKKGARDDKRASPPFLPLEGQVPGQPTSTVVSGWPSGCPLVFLGAGQRPINYCLVPVLKNELLEAALFFGI